jgi:hypothetical protein
MVELNSSKSFQSLSKSRRKTTALGPVTCAAKSVDDMVQCLSCHKWVNENCAGVKARKRRLFPYDCGVQLSKIFS